MKTLMIRKKASFNYRIVSFFVTKMPRLKIYQKSESVEKYIDKISADKKTPENFKENAKFKADYEVKEICGMRTYILNPKGKNTILYLHGGAYINRPTSHHMNFASKIGIGSDSRILVPYYPLAPFNDVGTCLKNLCEFIETTNEKFILLGDSAGGGLCFSLLYALQEKNLDNFVKAVVSVSPWLDMTEEKEHLFDRMLDKNAIDVVSHTWSGELLLNHPYCSPCFADFKNQFHALIIVGGREVLHNDTAKFIEKNKDKDIVYVEYENLEHDFPLYPVPETKNAISLILDYILPFNNQ